MRCGHAAARAAIGRGSAEWCACPWPNARREAQAARVSSCQRPAAQRAQRLNARRAPCEADRANSSIGSGAAVMRASYATLADELKEPLFQSFLASIRNRRCSGCHTPDTNRRDKGVSKPSTASPASAESGWSVSTAARDDALRLGCLGSMGEKGAMANIATPIPDIVARTRCRYRTISMNCRSGRIEPSFRPHP